MDIKLTGVVKYGGKWHKEGDVLRKVDDEAAKQVISAGAAEEIEPLKESEPASKEAADADELQELREQAKELGVPNAGKMGEANLRKAIAEAEVK